MLTILHISDVHMTTMDQGTQFDEDFKIRQAMLEDLGHSGRSDFDAILVTGDVAYHGRTDEYQRAKTWLEEVRLKCKCAPDTTLVVPGNHDVDRSVVYESSTIWDLHQGLRSEVLQPQQRAESLTAKLKDPSLDFLAALKHYRAFAGDFGCSTSCEKIAWAQFLGEKKHLEDGSIVRFHGLNSSIFSDRVDKKANLYLSNFQFQHFDNDPRYVNVVLCHHPHTWLIDGNESNDFFQKQAHLIVTGHEHEIRCFRDGGSLRVCAGAIHPNRRENFWQPTYNVIRLSIVNGDNRILQISVETRVWKPVDKCFRKHSYFDHSDHHVEKIELPTFRKINSTAQTAKEKNEEVVIKDEQKELSMSVETYTVAMRKLKVYFFRLGPLPRYETAVDAGVWSDEDDSYEGQERWARVFERAEKLGKLNAFWKAVAAKHIELASEENPFTIAK
jgi:predicted phosphodiesterase